MLKKKSIPQHIAIIMDGNGRWAKKRGLSRIMGHRAGIDTVSKIIEASLELGIKYLTLYTFSSENWNRPKREINALMKYLKIYLKKELKGFNERGIRVVAIGELKKLPASVQDRLYETIEKTRNNSKLVLILALSYGSRLEIVDAVKRISSDVNRDKIKLNQIDEKLFSKYLYTAAMPDPDLLIRTSHELRLSNFLLWQLSYTELYFSHKLWPDFSKKDLLKIIEDYQERERRFGKV